ncbi:MAG: RNase adapter RapZ [Kordiimonadaceae bacterium]|nr:RNase adapter RapZ [Kordiimonadaceae bacterium]MBO6567954.1 RNase adapter RapZ [Kordiimonadaceae bacterium]MBO6964316.1 RNase adapter RapZ [Kordiimonadaceae bacterium]
MADEVKGDLKSVGSEKDKLQLVIVTGLSGAGKSAALHAFEDIGFHAVDNLPLTLIETLVDDQSKDDPTRPLVIGVDSRTLHFSPEKFVEVQARLKKRKELRLHVLFMDASDDVLTQRFSETRRPHPLSDGKLLRAAIRQERDLMTIVREHIDGILDTSSRTGAETRRIILRRFAKESDDLIVTFMSFGFAHGAPRDADLVFDVRFLRNPHYVPELKPLTGREDAVSNYVRADDAFNPFVERVQDLLSFLMPRYQAEGKAYLTIAFGCTGGQHRSVATAEAVAGQMAVDGLAVNLFHRELASR